ncbi:unnamed protein product [Leptosia nina]|uniref:G-protein coupled receptors family 1 profile domain-containing protein n=1 Tax=Leptosia nina TaxID=320188 RepID=A0AAV1JNV9_9NEOP
MTTIRCVWADIFSEEDISVLQHGLEFTDTASAVLGLWLNLSLLLTNLRYDLGYRNLAFFTLISCIQRIFAVANNYFFTTRCFEITDSCVINGFWNTFLSVYEVECLTHVCIERYVVTKYINNGWALIRWHYTMYQGLCIFFALLYSMTPLLGVGEYALDFTCKSCAFDMVLPDTLQKYFIILVFLLRSVKSASFMVIMLYWARKLEGLNKTSKHILEEAPFTKSVIVITIVNLLCWWPITAIRGSVVLSSFLHGYILNPPATLIQWALWVNSAAPALTVMALYIVDRKIRKKMNKCETSPAKEKKI